MQQPTTLVDEVVNPTPNPAAAQEAFERFVAEFPCDIRLVCLHDSDADGIAAGVVWQRVMERLGYDDIRRVMPDRERSAWTPENRQRAAVEKPGALYVLDLGSQCEPVVPGVPSCAIDHHRPEGTAPDTTLICAYSWDPIPNTSLMMYDLAAPLVEVSDLEWIAAIGTFSDLGEKAPFPLIESSKKRYMAKYLKEATTLVNAVRRASTYAPEIAARALLAHDSARSLVESEDDDVRALRDARAEVKSEMEQAKKAAPQFSGGVALIRIHSRCQIHPLIAQIWRSRLPKYVVIAANDGYIPNRINFSARSGDQTPTGALALLRSVNLSDGDGNFGHGHDMASGGSLPPERWAELLGKLGFGTRVIVIED